jgi:hypothetical protein
VGTDRVQTLSVPMDGGPNTLSKAKKLKAQGKRSYEKTDLAVEAECLLLSLASAATVVTAEVTARMSQYGEAADTAGSYTHRGRACFLARTFFGGGGG